MIFFIWGGGPLLIYLIYLGMIVILNYKKEGWVYYLLGGLIAPVLWFLLLFPLDALISLDWKDVNHLENAADVMDHRENLAMGTAAILLFIMLILFPIYFRKFILKRKKKNA